VRALVLAAPSANALALSPIDRVLAAPIAGATMVAGASAALSLAPVRRAAAARLQLDERYLRGLAKLLARPASWRAFVSEQRALIRGIPQLEPQLDRIAAPTVILAGAADRVVPPAAATGLAGQIPGAELVLIEHAGHLLPHQHAGRLAGIIRDLASDA
jgi:pimeloyl-ACP methyl ester carboxylesterase